MQRSHLFLHWEVQKQVALRHQGCVSLYIFTDVLTLKSSNVGGGRIYIMSLILKQILERDFMLSGSVNESAFGQTLR